MRFPDNTATKSPWRRNSHDPAFFPMNIVPVIGLPVAAIDYAGAVAWILDHAAEGDKAYAVEAANTHVAALARADESFGEAMSRFDLICPDGMPLVWTVNASIPPEEKLKDRVYGPTLMLETLRATNSRPDVFKHFLLGGKPETLERLRSTLAEKFPDALIADAYSPPFGQWPEGESESICTRIRTSGANLIWVGLGCPKQERWIATNKDLLPPGVYFGIGAAFGFHAGEVRQAPGCLQKLGLEWAFRLLIEPRRLFRRYFTYNSLFVYYSIRDRMGD